MLDGQGGDETLLGYGKYYLQCTILFLKKEGLLLACKVFLIQEKIIQK